MRTAGSAFFAVFAVVFALVALPSAWAAAHIVSEDRFVQLASPLGDDSGFTQALAGALAEGPAASPDLPDGAADTVRPIVAELAEQMTELPDFERAWDETLRRSHALTFAERQSLLPETDAGSSFTLDVAPLLGLVTSEIGGQFGLDVAAPEQTLVAIGQGNQRAVVDRVESAASLWPALAAAAAVGALVSLVLARRRSTTLALLGLGAMLVGALLWLVAESAPQLVGRATEEHAVAEVFTEALAVRAADSFQAWCLAAAAIGVLVMAAGVVARLLRGARR